MARQLEERGISSASFRSHQVTADDVAWADVVLTMEKSHREFLLEDHPKALTKIFTLGHFADRVVGADLRDPYRRGELAAARIVDLVDTTIVALG